MSLRWGIIGTGNVAKQIAEALTFLQSPITAVASRKIENAQRFAQQFHIEVVTDHYDSLCQRDDIDVVYVALPHTLHYSITLCALSHGKHVLCEKPIGVNKNQAEQMFTYAKQQRLLLMEAMWTRHIPLLTHMVSLVKSGLLGDVRLLKADFSIDEGIRFPAHRLLDPSLAGGALLDTGVYPLTISSMIFGDSPHILWSQAYLEHGVDMDNFTVLEYPTGAKALLYSGISGSLPEEALIICNKGYVRLYNFFYPQKADICSGGVIKTVNEPFLCNGYEYQLKHMESCIMDGIMESPVVPHQCSLNMMDMLDKLRDCWGLIYPQEQEV